MTSDLSNRALLEAEQRDHYGSSAAPTDKVEHPVNWAPAQLLQTSECHDGDQAPGEEGGGARGRRRGRARGSGKGNGRGGQGGEEDK